MLRTRILTALVLAPLAVYGVLFLSTERFAAALAALFALALWEWTRLIGFRTPAVRLALVVVLGVVTLLIWQQPREWLWWTALIGTIWWLLALIWLANFDFAAAPNKRYRVVKSIAGALIVVPAWAAAVWLHGSGVQGPAWTMALLLVVWSADVFAYFSGRAFGKAKLAPRISPGKTRAGLWGALIGSALVAYIAALILKVDPLLALWIVPLALVTVLFSVAGDLFESLIKRHSQQKDSGRLFPGHGGAFDRLDSVFAALPIFVIGKSWLLP